MKPPFGQQRASGTLQRPLKTWKNAYRSMPTMVRDSLRDRPSFVGSLHFAKNGKNIFPRQGRFNGARPKWKFPTPEIWPTRLVDLSSRPLTKTGSPQQQMESTCAFGKSSRTENGKSWLTSIIRTVSQRSVATLPDHGVTGS